MSTILLKADSRRNYDIWYNAIMNSVSNIESDNKIKSYEKSIRKLENTISQIDRKEVASLFSLKEEALKTENRRSVIFDSLICYDNKYEFLGDLYNLIASYDTMRKLKQYKIALSSAKSVYEIINISDANSDNDNEDKEIIQTITDEKISKELKIKLDKAETEGPEAIANEDLFSDLMKNLINKIIEVRTKIQTNTQNILSSIQDWNLLSLPVSFYKRSNQWTMPQVLEYFGKNSINNFQKSSTVKIGPSEKLSANIINSLRRSSGEFNNTIDNKKTRNTFYLSKHSTTKEIKGKLDIFNMFTDRKSVV